MARLAAVHGPESVHNAHSLSQAIAPDLAARIGSRFAAQRKIADIRYDGDSMLRLDQNSRGRDRRRLVTRSSDGAREGQ
jgi:hypothetical protein